MGLPALATVLGLAALCEVLTFIPAHWARPQQVVPTGGLIHSISAVLTGPLLIPVPSLGTLIGAPLGGGWAL